MHPTYLYLHIPSYFDSFAFRSLGRLDDVPDRSCYCSHKSKSQIELSWHKENIRSWMYQGFYFPGERGYYNGHCLRRPLLQNYQKIPAAKPCRLQSVLQQLCTDKRFPHECINRRPVTRNQCGSFGLSLLRSLSPCQTSFCFLGVFCFLSCLQNKSCMCPVTTYHAALPAESNCNVSGSKEYDVWGAVIYPVVCIIHNLCPVGVTYIEELLF